MLKCLKFLQRQGMKEIIITLKIEKQKPMQLQNLSNAILSLNESLNNFITQDKGMGNVELQLKSVEKGSDIFNFLVFVNSLLPPNELINAINNYFNFFISLKSLIIDKTAKEIQTIKYINKKTLKNIENIINLHNPNADALIFNNINKQVINIDAITYPAYKENINTIANIKGYKEKKEIKIIFENMLIEFYQTTNTEKDLKHKAYCYNLDNKPKDIIITDKTLKAEMLQNPYNYKFLVDLEIYKDENENITTYRAFNYQEKILK